MVAASKLEGEADDVGRHLARMARQMRDAVGPDCLITGGEPAVTLADAAERGMGGRNQQLVLAALHELADVLEQPDGRSPLEGIVILAGGTDGEDGPTDAAGAWVDEQVDRLHQQLGLHKLDFLRRNDAYHFFQPLGALIKTGPTHTNVCDLRVVVVSRAR
jgi:glycerate-2-kinase